MFYLVIGYVSLFFQGLIITLLFNQLNVVSLQRKFIMLLSISMLCVSCVVRVNNSLIS